MAVKPMDIFLKFLFLLCSIYLQTVSGCEIYRFVSTDNGEALKGHVIKTITKDRVNFCWSECVWLPWCFSINARQTSDGMFECELNNSSKKANPTKMETRKGWSYHEMKDVDSQNCKFYDCKRKEDLGDGWRRYGDSAIKLFQEKKTWTDARSHCQSLGGDLLSITSSHENDFVNDVFVENLNLTYIPEDKIIQKPGVHYKLNGKESNVTLQGTPGDANYEFEDREKALYLKGKKGYAQVPADTAVNGFFISFWAKISNHTQLWSTALSIYNATATLLMTSFNSQTQEVYYFTDLGGVGKMFSQRFQLNVWQYFSAKFTASKSTLEFGYQGLWNETHHYKLVNVSSFNFTSSDKWLLGVTSVQTSNLSFHGHIKHLVFIKSPITEHKMQTVMYWHEQGVWIGLNNPDNSTDFSWSDSTPTGEFMNLPDYKPNPRESKRKCVAMAKDKKWLDKHCHLKYPYLCEKPVPP